MKSASRHSPLIVALLLLWTSIGTLAYVSTRDTEGYIIYTIDDPYIHMTIARNMALHGTWGINPDCFSSTSSSPLWTLILTGIFLSFGVSESSPLVANAIAATFLVILAYFLMYKSALRRWLIAVALMALVFVTPLPALCFCGQEHIIHALLTVAFSFGAAKFLADKRDEKGARGYARYHTQLLVLAPLLASIRYEGIFLVMVVSFLSVIRRRIAFAVLLLSIGLLPTVVYGIVSLSHGWYFLPNPVVLKGFIPQFSVQDLLKMAIRCPFNLYREHALLALVSGGLFMFYIRFKKMRSVWDVPTLLLAIFLLTSLLHLEFAQVGWFYRYEAYLISLGILAVGIALSNVSLRDVIRAPFPILLVFLAAVIVFTYPLLVRAGRSYRDTPGATANIFRQQYQMGSFLRECYPGQAVAVNDIGAVSFFSTSPILDLWGLANMPIADATRRRNLSGELIDSLARAEGAVIAIIYDNLYQYTGSGEIPSTWVRIGQWHMPNNLVCYNETVSFYAIDSSQTETLQTNFESFSERLLPKDVIWNSDEPRTMTETRK